MHTLNCLHRASQAGLAASLGWKAALRARGAFTRQAWKALAAQAVTPACWTPAGHPLNNGHQPSLRRTKLTFKFLKHMKEAEKLLKTWKKIIKWYLYISISVWVWRSIYYKSSCPCVLRCASHHQAVLKHANWIPLGSNQLKDASRPPVGASSK